LVAGAAIGARAKRPSVALVLALASHFVLDATPHFDIAWIGGSGLFKAIDIGLGLLLTGVIIWRVRHWWPLVGAVVAVLPDAPGLKERWDTPPSSIFPHLTWDPPWGIAVEFVVAGAALLWGMRTPTWTE